MPIYPYGDQRPRLGARAFVAPSAEVMGDVEAGDDVSFWFQTVVRGDVHAIRIGSGTNLQDGVIVHVSHRTHPTHLGRGVVVGHGAILHGCTIEDGALIGIGARILDGAVVEAGAQIGAGALVAPGHRIPAGMLALGVPARVVRPLRPDESAQIVEIRERYIALKERYRDLPGVEPR
ncbi:MAG: gamma carbonic anhydrase family protein [Acidobacteriota bacterium]